MNLSPRERQIARLILEGKTDRQIAGEMGLSWHTVRTHRKSAFAKLKIHKAVELSAYRAVLQEAAPLQPEAPHAEAD